MSTWTGSFDPNKDTYLSAAAFPAQTPGVLGNATRFNPLVRGFPEPERERRVSASRSL